jgi:hypothetical protein
VSSAYAGASVTIPVAVYLATLWYLQVRPNAPGRVRTVLYLIAAAFVLASTFTPRPVIATAVIVAALVAINVWSYSRATASPHPSPPRPAHPSPPRPA